MEIERINENTVKFYISYLDIENRGFDRDEIWYNREKSEQLFWDMMDEINEDEDFIIDGPLWIQVHAMDKGLEVLVTKAQMAKDGKQIEFSPESGKFFNLPFDENMESLLGKEHIIHDDETEEEDADDSYDEMEQDNFAIVIRFQDIEHLIQLSHSIPEFGLFEDQLYHLDSSYYLYLEFDDEVLNDEEQENILSLILEFGNESGVTIHRLMEYGKVIYHEHALQSLSQHFPLN